jgi:hypothetical protein
MTRNFFFNLKKNKKRRLAQESRQYNVQDSIFCELYPELAEEITESIKKKEQAERERQESLKRNQGARDSAVGSSVQAQVGGDSTVRRQDQNWIFSFMSNVFVMIALAAFAYIVKYVLNTIS